MAFLGWEGKRNFWMVLAGATGEVLVAEGMGPAYSIPRKSFRAEGYGLLSLLIFLFLVLILQIHTSRLLCDNKAYD
jgi:hypothetical protein